MRKGRKARQGSGVVDFWRCTMENILGSLDKCLWRSNGKDLRVYEEDACATRTGSASRQRELNIEQKIYKRQGLNLRPCQLKALDTPSFHWATRFMLLTQCKHTIIYQDKMEKY